MAQIIAPIASRATERQISPTWNAPQTEFPYPVNDSHSTTPARVDSDATLYEEEAATNNEALQAANADGFRENPVRPSLPAAKFQTEILKPVATQPLPPLAQRRSTGAQVVSNGLDIGDASSSDESESSSEGEETPAEEHLRTPHRDRGPLRKSMLNRVQRHQEAGRDPDGRFSLGNKHFRSRGKVARDGRLNISVNETANSGYLAKALGATIRKHLHPPNAQEARAAKETKKNMQRKKSEQVPQLNIVIMVIGSRGDIQPFLKIGKILQDKYHHRVRIATHPTFRKFVEEDIGLEFFSVGGDPSELMSFMVKNPGLIPSLETVKAGEIGRRRESMFQMFQGFWRACINATDDETDVANLKMMGGKYPFIADAIIANPPSFAHFHCAEKLGVPLHMVFTFPYTPTQDFPHPLANIKASNVDQSYTNFMSYPLVDLMTWQGLGDLVNRFRVKTLGLDPISTLWAPGQFSRLKVPMTYLWSPGLVPKPEDWGPEIDVAGYVFLDLASSFKPEQALSDFLEKKDGREIVYIGFGSISGIEDPAAFTKLIFGAVEATGVRAVVSRGWGGMGDGMDVPETVFLVDNVPHDWLFPKMDAVIHHGGAGTTAIGLKCGKPTMIVPFFGDQPFWSAMIVRAGAGAKESLPLKKLNVEKFAEGIKQCLAPEAKKNAQNIAASIEAEGDGAENAVNSFHSALPIGSDSQSHGESLGGLRSGYSMRCGIFDDRVAVWKVKKTHMRLSALAADLLVENQQLQWKDLSLARHYEWHDFQGPGEPLTGAGGAALASLQEAIHGMTSIRENAKKDIKKYEHARRKQRRQTVADAMVVPGQIALAARGSTIESQKAQYSKIKAEANLEGEAAPPRLGAEEGRLRLSRTSTSATDPRHAPVALLKDVGWGLGHSVKAVASMPFEIGYALTLGFRNAPRLYGDTTVRPPPNTIKGLGSGLAAAGNELWLGFYDGITGVVRIPYQGVREDGLSSLPKGLARGLGGLVLKPTAGLLGLTAYTEQGVRMEIRKRIRDTKKTERFIRRARMNQGAKDILEYQTKSTAPRSTGPNGADGLREVRTQALTQWDSCSKAVAEAQHKEKRKSLLPKRGTNTV